MSPIQRVEYDNRNRKNSDFEIIDLRKFYATRPQRHLESDYRLNFYLLMYITEGEGSHCIDFVEYPYKRGDLVIIRKNQVHHFLVNAVARGYVLIFNEPFFFASEGLNCKDLLEFFNRSYKSPVLSVDNTRGTANRILMDLIYGEYGKGVEGSKEALVRSLLQSFILSLEDYSREDRALIDSPAFHTYHKFRTLIEQNYQSKKSVEDYVTLLGVSKKTINAATRSVVGLSAKEFITERVILEIKRYLSLGELLAYEISDAMGFDEPSNMTKFFKRYSGMSPSDFKKSLK